MKAERILVLLAATFAAIAVRALADRLIARRLATKASANGHADILDFEAIAARP